MIVDVEDGVVQSFKAFEVGSIFRFNKCLHRLDLTDIKSPPYKLWGVSDPGRDSLLGEFLNLTENCFPPRPTSEKKHHPCILEGRLTTNPI